jgi:hypothetical protein
MSEAAGLMSDRLGSNPTGPMARTDVIGAELPAPDPPDRQEMPHKSHSRLGQGRVESSINAERALEELRASDQMRKWAI